MPNYKTSSGQVFDISDFNLDEGRVFTRLMQEYGAGQVSWADFYITGMQAINRMSSWRKKDPTEDPLLIILADLAKNLGIQQGTIKGEISDMLIE